MTGSLRRGDAAPPPRTLVDVFRAAVATHPRAPALDDGNTVLSYRELAEDVGEVATRLRAAGVRRGDRIGVRLPSGTHGLYTSILGVLVAGAAYVPVDLDDPDERATLVFREAAVDGVLTAEEGFVASTRSTGAAARDDGPPGLDDDAWIIFTSGSTGTPKGVAVTHRNAAAFVDAEARLFLQGAPLRPGDRVLAGLSVAFDASCEEMWLAWRHGACLVPAPRALVRSGMDLGPWLVAQRITAVSTVPTLASIWPADALGAIRLLIFGGEACPPELAARLAVPGRELWNTYGPTEATVVACAAALDGQGPVRIGLPLDGWDLAVVGKDGEEVPVGEVGELIIGGVGLARYLDPAKDAEKYSPLPTLGWERAYRSGDLVRHDPEGLLFVGRADDQVKLGGRRIELGEVDTALRALPHVAGAAAAVRTTGAGNQILVGYVAPVAGAELDLADAVARLRIVLPAALVPRLAVVDSIPTRTSGKVDRDALPWPLGGSEAETTPAHGLPGTAGWLADQWTRILGASISGADDDFFAHGGGSLSAAQLVSVLRERYPEVTVADVYENPRLGRLADLLEEFSPTLSAQDRTVEPVPPRAQSMQTGMSLVVNTVVGLRWLTWLGVLLLALDRWTDAAWVPDVNGWWVLLGWLVLISPLGRMALAVAGARLLTRRIRPGTYPRGGGLHLRLWCAEAWAAAAGAENLAAAPWINYYARALGASVGPGVDLHAVPPVTGLLTLGRGCSIEPEVDLSGHWLDGDRLHVGRVRVGPGATVGARSTLLPGTRIGQDAEIAPGSAVLGHVPPGEFWAGSPAEFSGMARRDWPATRPGRRLGWAAVYGVSSLVLGSLPLVAAVAGLAVLVPGARDAATLGAAARSALLWSPLATVVAFGVFALLTLVAVRLLGLGLSTGYHPVRSRVGWQVWATERLMDDARTWLFPIYASLFSPIWLRGLGATVGTGVEASTVLLLPRMTTVGDHAFLADDTLIGSYELGGGWLRIEKARVGKRAFLGNSGMTAPGRKVPKDSLVAVLSAAPRKAKKGTSWVGSPPVQMRRAAQVVDASRTYAPPTRLKVARGCVEVLRIVPTMASFALGIAVLAVFAWLLEAYGGLVAALAGGVVVLLAGAVAAGVTTLAKWALVGRIPAREHPLWSSFVWRNELADTFVEMLAAPWFTRPAAGTPALVAWLRTLGAHIGRGVWCESYWLPEADLVHLADASTVNRGCVVQTHLFHDRILQMDTVTLERGATLGPHGVILPAATIGESTTIGPSSLVMRGEAVPAHTRWTGNPIAFWPDEDRAAT